MDSLLGPTIELDKDLAKAANVSTNGSLTRRVGASTSQQFIKAGLLDEFQIHLVPVLLGADRQLFDQSSARQLELQPAKDIESPNVTHLRFRFVK
jgi:dihydrofolate reductase